MNRIQSSNLCSFQNFYAQLDDVRCQIDDNCIVHIIGKTLLCLDVFSLGQKFFAKPAIQCGDYLPCGVIFIEEGSKIPNIAVKCVLERYRPDDYNSSGPLAMRNLINSIDLSRSFNAPYNYFYPINSSAFVNFIYDGKYIPDSESYSMHWYGGSKLSQKFNQEYTEEMARESNDSVSKIIREQGLV